MLCYVFVRRRCRTRLVDDAWHSKNSERQGMQLSSPVLATAPELFASWSCTECRFCAIVGSRLDYCNSLYYVSQTLYFPKVTECRILFRELFAKLHDINITAVDLLKDLLRRWDKPTPRYRAKTTATDRRSKPGPFSGYYEFSVVHIFWNLYAWRDWVTKNHPVSLGGVKLTSRHSTSLEDLHTWLIENVNTIGIPSHSQTGMKK